MAATFTGIITALKQYAEELRDGNISIWVRRAGPNYQEVRLCCYMMYLGYYVACRSILNYRKGADTLLLYINMPDWTRWIFDERCSALLKWIRVRTYDIEMFVEISM